MAIYTPGMGSAQPVGQLPVEKTAYDTKNRMMQMDMMGMRAKAMADAAMKAKKTQEEKDLLAIKAGDADYFQELYNEKNITPAIQNLLTLKKQGMLTEANKLAVTGDLDAKAKEYKTLADETKAAVNNVMVGMEKVYDPGVLLAGVKSRQFAKLRANQPYSQTELQADIEEEKKNLKSLQSANINSAFVKSANERKNKVQVARDPTGLYKTGRTAEAQSYWQLDPSSGRIKGFDFDGFYGDYTTPGTPTQQLYLANKNEKLKDPNFKKEYESTIDKLTKEYGSNPAKLESAVKKYDAEKFILPYFGEGKRWEDFFAKSETSEEIKQYVAPTERQLEQKDAEYAGAPQVEIVVSEKSNGRQVSYQTTIGATMTKEQAQNFKPDIKNAYVENEYGRVTKAPLSIKTIGQGSSQPYSIVARTALNTSGVKLYDKDGREVNLRKAFNYSQKYKDQFFSQDGKAYSGGGDLNIEDFNEFIRDARKKGYKPVVKGSGGTEVEVQSARDLAAIPGVLQQSSYFKVDLPTGQDRPVGSQGKEKRTYTQGKVEETQPGVTINVAGPGQPKSIYFPTKFPSAIKTIAQKNMGQTKLQQEIEKAKKAQEKAILSGLGGAITPAQGTQNQVEEFEFE